MAPSDLRSGKDDRTGQETVWTPDGTRATIAKLVIGIVMAVFVAGLALTRRPRQQRCLGPLGFGP